MYAKYTKFRFARNHVGLPRKSFQLVNFTRTKLRESSIQFVLQLRVERCDKLSVESESNIDGRTESERNISELTCCWLAIM